jgi:hypothetical protein
MLKPHQNITFVRLVDQIIKQIVRATCVVSGTGAGKVAATGSADAAMLAWRGRTGA